VRPNRSGDDRDAIPIVPDRGEVLRSYPCTFLFMGKSLLLLKRTGYVMEEGGRKQDIHVRMFLLTNDPAQVKDPFSMVHAVRSRFTQHLTREPVNGLYPIIHDVTSIILWIFPVLNLPELP
jgi:hypothetical protein